MCCVRLAENTGRKKIAKKSSSGHYPTTLSGYIFATKACIDNWKKLVKQQYLLHMSPQYGELCPTSGWDRFVSLGHPCKFQRVSCLGSVTARHSSSGRQSNFAALNRACHLYSAGWPSRALAHISSYFFSLHNYFSFIIVSVYVTFIFHLIITKFALYPLLDYMLYWIVPVIQQHIIVLTAGLQAHISRCSIYLLFVWLGLYSWYLHTLCTWKFLSITCMGNVCPENVLSRKVIVWQASVKRHQYCCPYDKLLCPYFRNVNDWTE